ncbi:MAG: hypothetical protein LKM39_15965 [Chiayiivirga sp.]|jgi:hypothetical protein|nr:hypothetical protein [Chiayiivirga sp.]
MTQWSGRGWTLAILALGLGVASDVPGAGLEDAQVGDSVQLFRPGVTIGKSGPDLVTLVRVDPYAEHARLWLDSGEGEARPLPRSPLRFFATSDRRLGERAYLVLEPDGKRFHSVVFAAGGGRRFEGEVDGQRLAVEASRPLDGADTSFQCAAAPRGYKVPEAAPPAATIATAKVAMYRAVVAVDTDNELMSGKFSNNTTLATNYLAELFVGMNVYYERDLDVRLAQGDTFLRVAADLLQRDVGLDAFDHHFRQRHAHARDAPARGVAVHDHLADHRVVVGRHEVVRRRANRPARRGRRGHATW